MTNNEIISKAKGGWVARPYDYDNNLWNSLHFQWIEDAGLVANFVRHLRNLTDSVMVFDIDNMGETSIYGVFIFIKSTPEQKAEALARAIKER